MQASEDEDGQALDRFKDLKACSSSHARDMENVMKKISLAGVLLGMFVGALAALLSGSWIFWLGAGLAIGLMVGAAQARRSQKHDVRTGAS